MSLAGVGGLFASILFHDAADIGPVANFALGALLRAVASLGQGMLWPESVNGLLIALSYMNFALAALQLLPADPFDGARHLRAWLKRRPGADADRTVSIVGLALAWAFLAVGILSFGRGHYLGGIWIGLLGALLWQSARPERRSGLVSDFMNREPLTISPGLTLRELFDRYVTHNPRVFPVVDGERLLGVAHLHDLRRYDAAEWHLHTVAEIIRPWPREAAVSAKTGAAEALALLQRSGSGALIVADGDRLVGVIALEHILTIPAGKPAPGGAIADSSPLAA